MKVFVGMPAYNEELIIGPAIKSTYDYVDKIFVVNGSKEGPSTDKTVEEAASVGSKVEIVSGTFVADDNSWGEQKQRQKCIDLMEKGENNWCIFQDADEVFDDPQIQRLHEHMAKALSEIKLFAYGVTHFWRDPWHAVGGGDWNKPRRYQAFRLIPGAQMLSYNEIGYECGGVYENWDLSGDPPRHVLDDVFYYHYGHVLTFERMEFKVKHFVEQGLCVDWGYQSNEWEKFRRERFLPSWNKSLEEVQGCKPYTGKHPEEVHHILEKLANLWKRYDG